MEELNCETAFTIPVFVGIPVAESVVVTWIIMAVLLLGSIILVRNLKVENVGKKQVVLETVVGGLYNFFYDLLGEDGKGYIPYLMTVGLYIGVANMIGLFGLKSPTKDVGVTGALALMSIVLIEFSGVHKKGVRYTNKIPSVKMTFRRSSPFLNTFFKKVNILNHLSFSTCSFNSGNS